jgi:hypothetical protein
MPAQQTELDDHDQLAIRTRPLPTMTKSAVAVVLFGSLIVSMDVINAFQPAITTSKSSRWTTSTTLFMGKLLRNKQAELQKKMALAKKQNASNQDGNTDDNTEEKLSDKEIKERNDRKRFDELLRGTTISNSGNSDDSLDYLSEQQEEEQIDAYQRGIDRLFEGDPAPTDVFEELVSIKSENAIGDMGAKRLIPWLRNGSNDYLAVICDPRVKSPEFRDTLKAFRSDVRKDILSKMVFVNADTPAENRRWLKKNNMMESGIRLFSDEKREWMQAYTALGENRWSMTLFVLAEERIQKLVRDLSSVDATIVTEKAIKVMEKRRI